MRLAAELCERIPCQQLAIMRLQSGTLQTAYASEKLMLAVDTYEYVLHRAEVLNVFKDQPEHEQPEGCPKDIFQFGSVMLLAISSINGEKLGVLQLVNRQMAPFFDEADCQMAEAFAASCGLTLSLERARDKPKAAAREPAEAHRRPDPGSEHRWSSISGDEDE